MTKKEVAKTMKEAGYTVKEDMIQQVKNEYNVNVFVCVVGDAMVVYTPAFKNPVKFVCF